ncbi:hypothetical protein BAE44_0001490 [Dichanthelium oligosanthes]|uniref:NB-ARC domain-containing protein n=1 Tax=Dichanthelium oligosanthes TaxID=888268 RepID=A0A1E5WJD7_9POAL|nr:hypothetical protein BAE44_0001490 [Dichanthelium oligosanthes]
MASGLEHDRCKLQFRVAYLQALQAEAEVKAVAPWAACLESIADRVQCVLDCARRRREAEAEAQHADAEPAARATRRALRYLTRQSPLLLRRKARRELRHMLRVMDMVDRVQRHFDVKHWHWASPDHEATDVMRSIIVSVTKERCDMPEDATVEELRRRAEEAVAGRRLLLVLDDMWGLDWRGKWEDVVRSLRRNSPPVGGPGSVVVVTTRSRRMAALAGTLPGYELPRLGEDDSWELLSRKAAFGVGGAAVVREEDTDGAAAGRRIAGKCDGVPLNLMVMGEFMWGSRRVHEWKRVAESHVAGIVKANLMKNRFY